MRSIFVFFVCVFAFALSASAQDRPGNISVYAVGNSFSSGGARKTVPGADVRFLEAHRISFGASYLQFASGGVVEHRVLYTIGGVEMAGTDDTTTASTKVLLGTVRVNFTKKAFQPFAGFGVGQARVTETRYSSNLKFSPELDLVNDRNWQTIEANYYRFGVPGQTDTSRHLVFAPTGGFNIAIPKTPLVISPSFTYLVGKEGYRAQVVSFGIGASF